MTPRPFRTVTSDLRERHCRRAVALVFALASLPSCASTSAPASPVVSTSSSAADTGSAAAWAKAGTRITDGRIIAVGIETEIRNAALAKSTARFRALGGAASAFDLLYRLATTDVYLPGLDDVVEHVADNLDAIMR